MVARWPRVFDAFSQADTTLDRSRGGLGLGLAMVKGLIELHGGTTSVDSAGLGKGAEFTICLPLEVTGRVAKPPAPRRALDTGPRRVLVIEDNVDAAESLREVLELDDNTVEIAFSGSEGINKAPAFGPDVVLCDIGLPGMDGYEVARIMRKNPALRATRLVALTGHAAPEDIAKAHDAGFDAHIAKPPSPEKLEEVLAASSTDR
jgi:two-component system, chemotaxis family, CheB/CheR fusion protein